MEEKKKIEKEAEEVPFRGMEQDLSSGMEGDVSGEFKKTGTDKQSAGEKSSADEPGYWAGMNPEDSSDTDMNKSRYAVWPEGKKVEETLSSAPLKEPEPITGSSQETTEKMARIGHELHGSDEVVLPGGAVKTSDSGVGEGRGQKAPGGMDFTSRVRKGDDGRHSDDWRIVSGKSGQVSRQAEDDLKKRQERDL